MAAVREEKVPGYLGTYPDNADVTVTDVKATTGTVTTTQIRSYRNPNPAPRLWGAAGEREAKPASGKTGDQAGGRQRTDVFKRKWAPKQVTPLVGPAPFSERGEISTTWTRTFLEFAGAGDSWLEQGPLLISSGAWLRARCYRRVSVMVMMLSRDSAQLELHHHDRDHDHDGTKTSTTSF
jgi:hypothetical protein